MSDPARSPVPPPGPPGSSGQPPAGSPASLRARPRLERDAHKGDAGRVLCLCGSETMPGAAILVLRAAQRAGAGLVTLGCLDRSLLAAVPPAVPEAVYADWSGEGGGADPLAGRDDHARLAGPGLGDTPRTRAWVERLLAARTEAPLALDADALNAWRGEPERLADCGAPLVITPHPGEASRLLGSEVPRDPQGRVEAALELSRRTRAVCCLKGSGTVVADAGVAGPHERVQVNATGNPGMATAGSGDVLAGALVACLADCHRATAGPWSPFDAACWAVTVHGLAGDLAARELGVRGVIASDLVAHLPAAENELEQRSRATSS